jgi:glycerate dehydrogenase
MKLVVLDGYALNPGDLSWAPLEVLVETEVFDRSSPSQVVERAAAAELVLTNKTPLKAEALSRLPQLRYIGVLATGYDVVDIAAARERGIVVTNIPTYGTMSVAQFTFALLLELCHHVGLHNDAVRNGEWSASPDWSFWKTPLVELAGKKLGIVGFGRIGQQVARIAAPFHMEVVVSSPEPLLPAEFRDLSPVSIEALLAESDVVTLHCPLVPETRGLIDAGRLARRSGGG